MSDRRALTLRRLAAGLVLASIALLGSLDVVGQSVRRVIRAGDFIVTYDGRGVTGLASTRDSRGADLVAPGSRLGVMLKYRVEGGDWLDLYQAETVAEVTLPPDQASLRETPAGGVGPPKGGPYTVTYVDDVAGTVLRSKQTFTTDGTHLDWTIEVANRMGHPVEIGDLAMAIPWRAPSGESAAEIFEQSWTKHQFVSGAGSFLYFVRPNGEPPYLVVTTRPGTSLEYYASPGGRGRGYLAFVHSARSAGEEPRGTWRQPNTSFAMGPAGSDTGSLTCGVRFRWADSYDRMREVLFEEDLFDVRVVPGMTVPEDLDAQFSLHTRATIEAIEPEFPDDTSIRPLEGPGPGYHVYRARFRRLGENRLTIVHDGGRRTYLEFFVTEPLETLIKKRARFITTRQQHRDPSKWYDGLYSVYDMRAKTLRGPDDTDGFDFWWGYVVAADDPVLGKAPFVASKNAKFPDADEIASLEYYLERFVWGKLQRTDRETPYPYGLHGVPNWVETRDDLLRARTRNNNLDKMKIWRSYDYPHMVMLYFHMYEIASRYPALVHYLDADGYLERAYRTARAYFTYPYEILPWYETYKWGCYNELVLLQVIDALDQEGRTEDAAWLRAEWEKKVKYFVYDDTYPFRSEYAIDRTAFESSYALAKYGATRDMKPDERLWYDRNYERWYSHPEVKREDSRAFMDRQLRAGLAVRGWLEAAYYLLGADFTGSSDTGSMSYMANMGGWGILDYGLNFAAEPWDWLELGYASYLSSWSLMNTGRPDTNYGFWFPGPENDGATGWAFMTAKSGRAWIRKDVPRGPWHYDGEIDLGYGAGLRIARTIVTDDPVFGTIAYGGLLTAAGDHLSIVPRDGVRQRLDVILEKKLRLELDRDGFAAGALVELDRALDRLRFTVENRTGDAHRTALRLALPGAGYELRVDGRPVDLRPTGDWEYPVQANLDVAAPSIAVEIRRR